MKTLSLRVKAEDLAWADRVKEIAAGMNITVSIMTGLFDQADMSADLIAVRSDQRDLWPKAWKAWIALSKDSRPSRIQMNERSAFQNGANMCYSWPKNDEAIRPWLNQITTDIPTD